MHLRSDLDTNIKLLYSYLPIDKSFDFVTRTLQVDGRDAFFLGINGFYSGDLLQKIVSDLQKQPEKEKSEVTTQNTISNATEVNVNSEVESAISMSKSTVPLPNLQALLSEKIGYAQLSVCDNFTQLIKSLLSGPCALLVDGYDQGILLDIRTYPSRGPQEPDMERITRGSRDGFVETMLTNTNLIRRRIRSPRLVFSPHQVGCDSKTDLVVVYEEEWVNQELLVKLERAIDSLQVTAITMGSKSLAELLMKKKWWNPLPSFQVTERPDVACSYLQEGHILILVDNSPLALILPCTIFQFTQSPDDYYKSPMVGSYVRLVRFLCIPVNLFLMPLFLLLTAYYPDITQKWGLLTTTGLSPLALFAYVIIAEFGMDLFKYSTSISSSRFSGSLSIVGGLLIGDTAVNLHWSTPEVLFYAAITMLTGISLSSPEFSDALRLFRMLLLVFTGFLGLKGFVIGCILIAISVLTTPTFGNLSYFWPLYPFNWEALKNLLFRKPTAKAQPTQIWNSKADDKGTTH